jgi:hypothetical protein
MAGRSEAMRHIHRAWRNPALPLLNFESVAVDQGTLHGLLARRRGGRRITSTPSPSPASSTLM